jgi:3'-5' exoribonuclease
MVHDIGKIYELSYERGFSYSDEGQLLGHMLIAVRMIGEKLRDIPDFPPRLRSLVEHMILSHHGQLEFGSPKTPVFPEAMLLHYLDDMDSKMECMRHLIETDRQVAGNFTSYSPTLERVLLKKDRYLAGPAPEEHSAPASPPASGMAAPAPAQAPAPAPAPKNSSPFGDKLLQALRPVEAKPEG